MGVSLAKQKNVRCGNWESTSLPKSMLDYAALDVYASYAITKTLALRVRQISIYAFGIKDILLQKEASKNAHEESEAATSSS